MTIAELAAAAAADLRAIESWAYPEVERDLLNLWREGCARALAATTGCTIHHAYHELGQTRAEMLAFCDAHAAAVAA